MTRGRVDGEPLRFIDNQNFVVFIKNRKRYWSAFNKKRDFGFFIKRRAVGNLVVLGGKRG